MLPVNYLSIFTYIEANFSLKIQLRNLKILYFKCLLKLNKDNLVNFKKNFYFF